MSLTNNNEDEMNQENKKKWYKGATFKCEVQLHLID
jgi:hypothetical protein